MAGAMATTFQPSMLDLADGGPRLTDLARTTRHGLSAGAWVDHLPGWISGSDGVLATLLHDVPWRSERRQLYDTEVQVPRLLAWYGRGSILPHPVLTDAHRSLDAHYRPELGEDFATAEAAVTPVASRSGTATCW